MRNSGVHPKIFVLRVLMRDYQFHKADFLLKLPQWVFVRDCHNHKVDITMITWHFSWYSTRLPWRLQAKYLRSTIPPWWEVLLLSSFDFIAISSYLVHKTWVMRTRRCYISSGGLTSSCFLQHMLCMNCIFSDVVKIYIILIGIMPINII